MKQYINILKKNLFLAHFCSIFPILGAKKKKKILENPVLSHTTSHGLLVSCKSLKKTNDTIPRKHPDRQRRTERQTEGRTDPIS